MPVREDDFPVQNIVPDGRKNAIGVRWWREFHRDIIATIQESISTTASSVANSLRLDQHDIDISANTANIATNTTDITANTANITANTNAITVNAASITANSNAITVNAAATAANTAAITVNASGILGNTTDITAIQITVTANTNDIASLLASLTTHEAVAASPGVLGHVLQGAVPVASTTVGLLPAGVGYVQADQQLIVDRTNDAHDRLDSLITSLQGAGVVQ